MIPGNKQANQQEDFIAYLADKFKEVADREYQRGREDERKQILCTLTPQKVQYPH